MVYQVGGHCGDEAEREYISGREQLAERGSDAELVHDGGQGGSHHALGNAGGGRAGDHDAKDEHALSLRKAVLLRRFGALFFGSAGHCLFLGRRGRLFRRRVLACALLLQGRA